MMTIGNRCQHCPNLPHSPDKTDVSPGSQKMARFQEYSVLGRKLPTEADPTPKL